MPRLTSEQRLEKAQKEAAQAMAELRSAAAVVSAKKRKKDRQDDTRRKVLGGAFFFHLAAGNATNMKLLTDYIATLDKRDKALFTGWKPARFAAKPAPKSAPVPSSEQPSAPAEGGAFEEKSADKVDASSRGPTAPASAPQES